ncbi:hypothetical protein FA95DRAFT_1488550 [Auriscalpium vulgare]|uniref:Uncharacterized protein n=1 Tax=Auriscalpium vulgare TaxID=40419 RepID=A0ACB8S0W3_9AGAM|nr:hypothetical protein FA95DRAFT_1488550 [Auriscalpium vulgare]
MPTLSLIAALVACASVARASLYPTQPVANTVFEAGRTVTIKWMDDGKDPTLDKLHQLSIELLGKGDTVIGKIAPQVDPASMSHDIWISPSLGPNSSDYYFRFVSDNPPMQFYTSRFTLTNMAGPASPNASAPATTFNASYTGTTVPLILTNMTSAPQSMRSFATSTTAGSPVSQSHPTGGAQPTDKDATQKNGAGGHVDVEKLKFRLVFILWPALIGISMAL